MEDRVKEQTQTPLPGIQQHPLSLSLYIFFLFDFFFFFWGIEVVVLYVCLKRHCRIGEIEASTLSIEFRD